MYEENFINAFLKGYLSMGQHEFFPFNPIRIDPVFADIFLEKIFNLIKKTNGKSIGELKQCFNPFLIRSELVYLMLASNSINFDKGKKKEIFDFFVNILKEQVEKDIFCLNGENILKEKPKFNLKKVDNKKLTGMLISSLNALTWSLYTDIAPSTGFELSGPYKILEGNVIVRDFFNLNPKELFDLNTNIDSIKIVALYDKIPLEVDFYGHLHAKNNLIENLLKQQITVNGKEINEKEVEELLEKINSILERQRKLIKEMNFEQIKEYYIKLRFYRYKKLFHLLGEKWEPEQEFLNRIKDKELLPEIPKEKISKEMLINLINPN